MQGSNYKYVDWFIQSRRYIVAGLSFQLHYLFPNDGAAYVFEIGLTSAVWYAGRGRPDWEVDARYYAWLKSARVDGVLCKVPHALNQFS